MEEGDAVTKVANREQYYTENGWDGAPMFGALFSGDRWQTMDADVIAQLKLSRMLDQVLWLAEVDMNERQSLLQNADTSTLTGVQELQRKQVNFLENKMMNIKHQMHRRDDQLMRAVITPTEPDGSCHVF